MEEIFLDCSIFFLMAPLMVWWEKFEKSTLFLPPSDFAFFFLFFLLCGGV